MSTIQTLSQLQSFTRQPLETVRFYNESPRQQTYLENASEMAYLWERVLQSQSVTTKESEGVFTANVFYAMQQPRTESDTKPVIVAAPPAFGKSSMLPVYLRYMCEKEPLTFGAVVIKERLEDVRQLVDQINEYDGATSKRRAIGIIGYNSDLITREQYEEQFRDQVNYPIVVMTTKQLELQTLKGQLSNFITFYNSQELPHRRNLLLIDEKPSLILNHTLTVRGLSDFLADVQAAGRVVAGKVQPYYRKVKPIVDKLRDILESPSDDMPKDFPAIDPSFRLPIRLEQDYARAHGHEQLKLMRAFERVVKYGGVYSEIRGEGTVTTTQVIHYEYSLFNTFIFDGTGSKDPDYNADNFYVMTPSEMPTYENVTFQLCRAFNLSRTALDQSPAALQDISTMIKRIVADKTAPTLVVTYAKHEDALADLLADEITQGKVIMKHFDGGRGSNAYTVADTAIYVGNLFKGTSYYSATAQAVVGKHLDVAITAEYSSTKQGIKFESPIVDEYRAIDMAVTNIQETNRLRASRKKQAVEIYIFNKDAAMIKHLIDAYPKATVKEFTPIEKLSGKQMSADEIVKYFAEMPSGSSVKGSDIQRALGIHRNTFGKEVASDRVVESMRIYGITKLKTRFIKS